MRRHKAELITFKVDASLVEALKGVENRSQFIRCAVLDALEGKCPLCGGTGILTPNQKRHWGALKSDHVVKECGECHELQLVCSHRAAKTTHGATTHGATTHGATTHGATPHGAKTKGGNGH
jgi:hypothetical protein